MVGSLWAALLCIQPVFAQNAALEFNTFGMPGAIDTPSASSLPDGTLMFTGLGMNRSWRGTLSFQALPRLTVALRYSDVDILGFRARTGIGLRDRSFDLHFPLD